LRLTNAAEKRRREPTPPPRPDDDEFSCFSFGDLQKHARGVAHLHASLRDGGREAELVHEPFEEVLPSVPPRAVLELIWVGRGPGRDRGTAPLFPT
jgi:hypothetical protein